MGVIQFLGVQFVIASIRPKGLYDIIYVRNVPENFYKIVKEKVILVF